MHRTGTVRIAALGLAVVMLGLGSQRAEATPINGALAGLPTPGATITFSEIVLPVGSPVTNEYAGLGVTFSPNLYYSTAHGTLLNDSPPDLTTFGLSGRVGAFAINFTSPVSAAAFVFGGDAGTATFSAYSGATPIESFVGNINFGSGFPNTWFGFTGITFDSISVSVNNGTNAAALDNLQFNKAVPEPGSLFLLGSGLFGLGRAWRKRRG